MEHLNDSIQEPDRKKFFSCETQEEGIEYAVRFPMWCIEVGENPKEIEFLLGCVRQLFPDCSRLVLNYPWCAVNLSSGQCGCLTCFLDNSNLRSGVLTTTKGAICSGVKGILSCLSKDFTVKSKCDRNGLSNHGKSKSHQIKVKERIGNFSLFKCM